MKKRVLSGILAMAMVFVMSMSVMAEGEVVQCDPFNNALFEVIGEYDGNETIVFCENSYESIMDEETYLYALCTSNGERVLNETYVHYIVQGNKLFCARPEYDDNYEYIYDVFDKDFNPTEGVLLTERDFNDGLKLIKTDEYWKTYQTIDGQEYFVRNSSYNLGYFVCHGDGFPRGTDILLLTEPNKTYYFKDSDFTELSDDYYAVLTVNEYPEDTSEVPMYGGSKSYKIRFKKGIIPSVQLDGTKIRFDQIPVIESGRTLVPVRAIFEAMGATLDWNGDTQTVTAVKDDTTIILKIDETDAKKNDETIKLDVPAKVINGRTMVPVRFIADCFGVDTNWDGDYQIVRLTSK